MSIVQTLRDHKFDVRSNYGGSENRLILMACDPDDMIQECERLQLLFPDCRVEVNWSPGEVAMLALFPDHNTDGSLK